MSRVLFSRANTAHACKDRLIPVHGASLSLCNIHAVFVRVYWHLCFIYFECCAHWCLVLKWRIRSTALLCEWLRLALGSSLNYTPFRPEFSPLKSVVICESFESISIALHTHTHPPSLVDMDPIHPLDVLDRLRTKFSGSCSSLKESVIKCTSP